MAAGTSSKAYAQVLSNYDESDARWHPPTASWNQMPLLEWMTAVSADRYVEFRMAADTVDSHSFTRWPAISMRLRPVRSTSLALGTWSLGTTSLRPSIRVAHTAACADDE